MSAARTITQLVERAAAASLTRAKARPDAADVKAGRAIGGRKRGGLARARSSTPSITEPSADAASVRPVTYAPAADAGASAALRRFGEPLRAAQCPACGAVLARYKRDGSMECVAKSLRWTREATNDGERWTVDGEPGCGGSLDLCSRCGLRSRFYEGPCVRCEGRAEP